MNLRKIETKVRHWRKALMKRIFSSSRFRRQLLDAMPGNVTLVTMELADHTLSFNPHELIGRSIFSTGGFERAHTGQVIEYLNARGLFARGNAVVVEVGANIGTQTLYFSLSEAIARIVAIEPDPENVAVLRRNIVDNKFDRKVTVCPVAVGDTPGVMTLHKVKGNSGNSSLIALPNSVPSTEVRIVTLADVIAEAGVARADVALIWVDIEGYEPNLWQSLVPFLENGSAVHMEFSPGMYGPDATLRFVREIEKTVPQVLLYERGTTRRVPAADLLRVKVQSDILMLRGL